MGRDGFNREHSCFACGEVFTSGTLDGNPQTGNGTFEFEGCLVCRRPLCSRKSCSLSLLTSADTVLKACLLCAREFGLTAESLDRDKLEALAARGGRRKRIPSAARWTAELASPEACRRRAALEGLFDLGKEAAAAAPAVLVACRDRDATVRRRAVQALGALGPLTEAGQSALAGLCGDPDEGVRSAAMATLGPVAGGRRLEAVAEGLRDRSPLVQEHAAMALLYRDGLPGPVALPVADGASSEVTYVSSACLEMLQLFREDVTASFPALAGKLAASPAPTQLFVLRLFTDHAAAAAPFGATAAPLAVRNSAARELARELLVKLGPAGRDALPGLVGAIGRPGAGGTGDEGSLPDAKEQRTLRELLVRLDAGSGAAVPPLLELLASGAAPKRFFAVGALRELGRAATPALPALQNASITDSDPAVREAAAAAVAALQVGPIPRELEAALTLVTSADPAERGEGVRRLEQAGPAAAPALSELNRLLKDPAPEVQRAAGQALVAVGPAAARSLLAALKEYACPVAVQQAILERASPLLRGSPELQGATAELLRYGASPPGPAAAAALAKLGPEAKLALPTLRKLLNDSSETTLLRAASVLATIGEPAVGVLLEALQQGRIPVKRAALDALARMGPAAAAAVEALATIVSTGDPASRGLAIEVLGKLGPAAAAARPALEKATQDRNFTLRMKAQKALAQLG